MEAYLSTATLWNVTFDGTTKESTGTTLVFTGVPNGTYSFSVPGAPYGLNVCPNPGTVTVSGFNVIQGIGFGECPSGQVDFTTNLSNFLNWSITFDGATRYSDFSNSIDFIGYLDGTYPYQMGPTSGWTLVPPSGTVTVAEQGPANFTFVQLTWERVLYPVTFNETGPDGGGWGVGLMAPPPPTTAYGGGTQSSNSSVITFEVANGTYTFIIDYGGAYLPSPVSGSVTVDGVPVDMPIKFLKPPSDREWVTFTETGLPAGSSWTVVLNGTPQSSSNTTIVFNEPNGTYPVVIPTADDLGPSPSNLTVSLEGYGRQVSVVFHHVYPEVFRESGLPSGTNWSVSVTANTTESVLVVGIAADAAFTTLTRWSDGADEITFYLSNGSYSFASSAPGETGNASTLTVSGPGTAPVELSFHPNPPSSTLLGEPYWLFGVIAAFGVTLIAAVVLLLRRKKRIPPNEIQSPEKSPPTAPK